MTTWTNKFNLPEPIVKAVQWSDRPEAKPNHYSVTTLLRPPQARALEKFHDSEITQDVSDGLWRLLGQAVHSVVERASNGSPGAELSLSSPIPGGEGSVLTGTTDHIDFKSGVLTDYKITSVWSFLLGDKMDWVAQTNMYKWLAEKIIDKPIQQLQIIAILRDHQKSKVVVDNPDYPPVPLIVQPVEIWDKSKVEGFILDRLVRHQCAEQNPSVVPCTSEERWERIGKFAVIKKGMKKAVRLLDSKEEAGKYAAALKIDGLTVEERPSKQTRCESYCLAAPWCEQRKKLGVKLEG